MEKTIDNGMALPFVRKAWRAATKVLLGEEIGELEEFSGWLSELPEPVVYHKSSISGKDVAYSVPNYCGSAKWLALDEVDYTKKFEPLSLNEMKDIDSVLSAIQERAYYCGGVVLGNSAYVDRSSNVHDGYYTYQSARVDNCKYIAYSSLTKESEYVFGSNIVGKTSYCMRGALNYKCSRMFETINMTAASACYFSSNLTACQEAMFCFSLRGKRHVIGNTEIEAGKYKALKEKLLSEICWELRRKKKFPSLASLVSKASSLAPAVKLSASEVKVVKEGNIAPIDAAFARTTGIIFGKEYHGLVKYGLWMERDVIIGIETSPSAVSGKTVFAAAMKNRSLYPAERRVTFDEGEVLGVKIKADEKEVDALSLQTLPRLLAKVGYVTPEFREGIGENVIECPIYADAVHAFRCSDSTLSKYCAYCYWARDSEHLFGTSMAFSSSFCIKCYDSVKLTRCFEVDSSSDCAGCYYCHNCENCQDCMFCFNVKNKKYAIGNVEVGPEKFAQAKKMLLTYLQRELDSKKGVPLSIFNVACRKK